MEFDLKGLEIKGELTGEQYWKWRLTIEEMDHAETRVKLAQTAHRGKQLEAVIADKDTTIMKKNLELAKAEYAKVKSEIEKDSGIDLEGCVIDPYSFEVKVIPEENLGNDENMEE